MSDLAAGQQPIMGKIFRGKQMVDLIACVESTWSDTASPQNARSASLSPLELE